MKFLIQCFFLFFHGSFVCFYNHIFSVFLSMILSFLKCIAFLAKLITMTEITSGGLKVTECKEEMIVMSCHTSSTSFCLLSLRCKCLGKHSAASARLPHCKCLGNSGHCFKRKRTAPSNSFTTDNGELLLQRII